MKTEIKINLVFFDFSMSPDDLSQKLGINATSTWRKGDQGITVPIRKKTNGWELSSGLDKSTDFEKHIDALLAKIRPHKQQFIEMGKVLSPVLSFVVYSYDGARPSMGFSKEAIQELAELNAEIDIDLYVL